MSNPNVLSVFPTKDSTDVILGSPITIVFDSPMDNSSINSTTFSLTGSSGSQVLTANQLVSRDPVLLNSRNFIPGIFTFRLNSSNNTVVVFTPSQSLQPNSSYSVLLVGSGAILVGSTIKGLDGTPLSSNYAWSFSTGVLNTKIPPLQSPLPYQYTKIDPKGIKVRINNKNAGDLLNQNIGPNFEVDIIFPGPIDPNSFSLDDVLLSLEQFLGDPTIPMPANLIPVVTVEGNTLKVIVQSS